MLANLEIEDHEVNPLSGKRVDVDARPLRRVRPLCSECQRRPAVTRVRGRHVVCSRTTTCAASAGAPAWTRAPRRGSRGATRGPDEGGRGHVRARLATHSRAGTRGTGVRSAASSAASPARFTAHDAACAIEPYRCEASAATSGARSPRCTPGAGRSSGARRIGIQEGRRGRERSSRRAAKLSAPCRDPDTEAEPIGTAESEDVMPDHEVLSGAHQVLCAAHQVLCAAYQVLSAAHEVLCRAYEVLSAGHEGLCRAYEVLCAAHEVLCGAYQVRAPPTKSCCAVTRWHRDSPHREEHRRIRAPFAPLRGPRTARTPRWPRTRRSTRCSPRCTDGGEADLRTRRRLICAVIAEHQAAPGPLGAAIVLHAFRGMLVHLSKSLRGVDDSDEADAFVAAGLLEALKRVRPERDPDRIGMYVRQETRRAVFAALRRDARARQYSQADEEAVAAAATIPNRERSRRERTSPRRAPSAARTKCPTSRRAIRSRWSVRRACSGPTRSKTRDLHAARGPDVLVPADGRRHPGRDAAARARRPRRAAAADRTTSSRTRALASARRVYRQLVRRTERLLASTK